MKRKILISVFFTLISAQISYSATIMRLGTSLPDSHPLAIGVKHFADLVKEKSKGEMEVKVYTNAILGNDVAMTSMVQSGTLDFTTPSTATLASLDDRFSIVSIPFLFKDKKDAFAALDGTFGKNLLQILSKHNLKGLTYYDHGFRQITNSKRPINNLNDINGLKIRVMQNKVFVNFFKSLDANPIPLPVNELFAALETKTVDAQENPLIVIVAKKFYEVQKYLTMTNHAYDTQVLIESNKLQSKLTSDQQAIIEEAAKESTTFQRKAAEEQTEVAIKLLSNHLKVNQLDSEVIDNLEKAARPIYDSYRAEAKALGLDI